VGIYPLHSVGCSGARKIDVVCLRVCAAHFWGPLFFAALPLFLRGKPRLCWVVPTHVYAPLREQVFLTGLLGEQKGPAVITPSVPPSRWGEITPPGATGIFFVPTPGSTPIRLVCIKRLREVSNPVRKPVPGQRPFPTVPLGASPVLPQCPPVPNTPFCGRPLISRLQNNWVNRNGQKIWCPSSNWAAMVSQVLRPLGLPGNQGLFPKASLGPIQKGLARS